MSESSEKTGLSESTEKTFFFCLFYIVFREDWFVGVYREDREDGFVGVFREDGFVGVFREDREDEFVGVYREDGFVRIFIEDGLSKPSVRGLLWW